MSEYSLTSGFLLPDPRPARANLDREAQSRARAASQVELERTLVQDSAQDPV